MTNHYDMKKGLETLEKLNQRKINPAANKSALSELTVGYLFAEVWNRPGLTHQQRSMITCTVLATMGLQENLKSHLNIACNLGIPKTELEEMLVQVSHYAGWSTGHNGQRILEELLAERAAANAKQNPD